ncbi:MAG: hypothetical protein SF069_15565 [Phycisphaerae bacterium]|nr:hypothetical protein [Phycisphaerae bacterium]
MFDWVWSISPLWWLSIALGVGTLLVAIGWRGRRIGDEPRCRRCGYILAELPSPICPECGVDSSRRKPRRGVRKLRAIPLIAGVLVLLASISPAIWIWRTANWRSYAPVWLLVTAVDFGDDAAARQLAARIRMPSGLTESQLRLTIARALEAQRVAPLRSERLQLWLDVLGTLDELDLLTDAEWKRMMRQIVRSVRARARDVVRRDEPLPLEIQVDHATPPLRFLQILATPVSVNGSRPDQVFTRFPTHFNIETDYWLASIIVRGPSAYSAFLPHDLDTGEHSLKLNICGSLQPAGHERGSRAWLAACRRPSIRAAIRDGRTPLRWDWPSGRVYIDEPAAIAAGLIVKAEDANPIDFEQVVEVEFKVVRPGSGDDLTPLSGEELRREVLAALTVERVRSYRKPLGWPVLPDIPLTVPRLRLTRPLPYALAFNVFAEQGNLRVRCGTARFPAGLAEVFRSLDDPRLDAFFAHPINLVLEPAPEWLRKTIDNHYFNEVIELGPIELWPP